MRPLLTTGAALVLAAAVSSRAEAQCSDTCGQVVVTSPPVIVVQTATPTVVVTRPQAINAPAQSSAQPLPSPFDAPPPGVETSAAPPMGDGSAHEIRRHRSFREWYLSRPPVRRRGLGIGLRTHAARNGEEDLELYGGGGVLRLIGNHRFGLELTVDGSISEDKVIIPVELSQLVFLNTRGRIQPYLLAGLNFHAVRPQEREVTFFYTGGHAGFGVELLMGRHLGVTFDGRSFVQGRRGDDLEGRVRYGVTFNLGFNFYFARHNRAERAPWMSCRGRRSCFARHRRGGG